MTDSATFSSAPSQGDAPESNEPETAQAVSSTLLDDKHARLRARNRLAQARARAKVKAGLEEAQQRRAVVESQLLVARNELSERRACNDALRLRLTIQGMIARQHLPDWRALAPNAGRPADGPPGPAPPHPAALRFTAHAPPRLAPLFTPPRDEGAPRRFAARIAAPLLPSDGPLFERLTAFQAREAQRLGCCEEDVTWVYECSTQPGITADSPIAGNLCTTVCKAKAGLAWIAARQECAMLLAMHSRLEGILESLPHELPPQTLPFPEFVAHAPRQDWQYAAHNGVAPPLAAAAFSREGEGRRSPPDGSSPAAAAPPTEGQNAREYDDAVLKVSHKMAAILLSDSRAVAVKGPPLAAQRRDIRTLAGVTELARHVLGGIFQQYVWGGLMHPADVVTWMRRCVRARGVGPDPFTRGHDDDPVTPATGFAAVKAEEVALIKRALHEACQNPRVPQPPATREAAERRMFAIEQRMRAVYTDWWLFSALTWLEAPLWTGRMSINFNPTAVGSAKFEDINVQAYQMLNLSPRQKAAVASAWRAYLARGRQLAAARSALAARLAALPSSKGAAEQLAAAHGGASPPAPPAADAGSSSLAAAASSVAPKAIWPPWMAQQPWSSPPPGGAAPAAAKESGPWGARLLGAAPDETVEAVDVLEGLRQVHREVHRAYVQFLCEFKHILTPRQSAAWFTAQLPFVADSHKIAVMACNDLRRDSVYGRAICGAMW